MDYGVVKTVLAKTAKDEGLLQGCTSRESRVTCVTKLSTVEASIRGAWYGKMLMFTHQQAMKAQSVSRGITTLSLTSAVDGG